MDVLDITTIAVSAAALVVSVYSFIINRIITKKADTIAAYSRLQEYLFFLYEYQRDEIETFVDDKTTKEYKTLGTCIAEIEVFATGIRHKVYDFNIAYDMSHGYIDLALRPKIEYIKQMRSEYASENYYESIDWLFEKMDAKAARKKK